MGQEPILSPCKMKLKKIGTTEVLGHIAGQAISTTACGDYPWYDLHIFTVDLTHSTLDLKNSLFNFKKSHFI